jgi:hypothetical protein
MPRRVSLAQAIQTGVHTRLTKRRKPPTKFRAKARRGEC